MFRYLLRLISAVARYLRRERAKVSQAEATSAQKHLSEHDTGAPPCGGPVESEPEGKVSQAVLLPKREIARAKLINAGIDFGTSSTKVFMRDITARQAYACAFPDALSGFGPFCWPSTIRVASGRLYFGTLAESMTSGRAIRSFKICLACQQGLFRQEDCATNQCLDDGGESGEFNLRGEDRQNVTFQPRELTSLYLANLIGILANEFGTKEPFGENCKWTYNMVAPLDMVDVPSIERTFEVALHYAYLIKDKIHQGISLQEAKEALNKVASEAPDLPSKESRRTFVVPETHAAMVGYIISGKAETGLYATIDVGAGSTDVSIFRYCSELAERDVAYYSSATGLLGGDAIDHAICSLLMSRVNVTPRHIREVLEKVRYAKHDFDEKAGMVVNGEHLSPGIVADAVNPVLENIFRHYCHTWGRGYEKEQKQHIWEHLNVLLLGGCNQLPFVRRKLSQNPSGALNYIIRNIETPSVKLPEDIKVLGSVDDSGVNDYASLLTIAHGLSFHIAENPEYFTPKEVPPLPPPPAKPEDDYKPFGHWW